MSARFSFIPFRLLKLYIWCIPTTLETFNIRILLAHNHVFVRRVEQAKLFRSDPKALTCHISMLDISCVRKATRGCCVNEYTKRV